MAEIPQLDEEEMQMIYNWVDEIPLSRPKRNIARDFSDGGKLFLNILEPYFIKTFHSNLKFNILMIRNFSAGS